MADLPKSFNQQIKPFFEVQTPQEQDDLFVLHLRMSETKGAWRMLILIVLGIQAKGNYHARSF
jgi:hypothetical protein